MNNYNRNVKSVPVTILLCLVTCGIYPLYWMYDTTRQLNEYTDDFSISPAAVVVLTLITCGLYQFYWWYKIGVMYVEAQQISNFNYITDNKLLYIVFAIFGLVIVSVAILQSDLNNLWLTVADRSYSDNDDFSDF